MNEPHLSTIMRVGFMRGSPASGDEGIPWGHKSRKKDKPSSYLKTL
jgi:hypothetical protein